MSLTFTTEWLIAFLLVLARVAGVIALAPLPGARLFPPATKVVLAVLLAALLLPSAQVKLEPWAGLWTVAAWMLRESAFGLAIGFSALDKD